MSPIERHLDIVGVGFGPANLSVALALAERFEGDGAGPAVRFYERQPKFGWHRGMLLEGATMQVSFLKDLATQRDPRSRYTFVNYLKERSRLQDFINLKTFFPTRIEFHDYLSWCAEAVEDQVSYGREVTRIEPVDGASRMGALLRVVTRPLDGSGREETVTTGVLLMAQGLTPRLPLGLQPGPRLWHTAELLPRLAALPSDTEARFAIVGSGQSAAEATAYIHRVFPRATVYSICSRYGYTPADDSPFVNRLFDPDAVDTFYASPSSVRARILADHAGTNYGVVDYDLISELYQTWYRQKVAGDGRLHFENRSQLIDVTESPDGFALTLRETGEGQTRVLAAEYLVCATGYDPVQVDALMAPALRDMIRRDEGGAVYVARNYQVETSSDLAARIILQGACERSHGLSATLISNLSVRAGEIIDSILRPAGETDVLLPLGSARSELAVAVG